MAEAKALLRLFTAESMRPKALGVSINGGTPKNGGWFIMGNPIKMDDLWAPPVSETLILVGGLEHFSHFSIS
jgi:hypothetical protein